MGGKIPIIPTIVVGVAVATMIALGIWQLGRKSEKEAQIATYQAALAKPGPELTNLRWDHVPDEALFRKARMDCKRVEGWRSIPGRNRQGELGFGHLYSCFYENWISFDDAGVYFVDVLAGWSSTPSDPGWNGGPVTGTISPGGERGFKIVSESGLAGLEPLADPDPRDLPNNHLAYAGQWFFFALTALVIYVLALRRKWKG